MKVFLIATMCSETHGHGDFGTELKICKMGDYGTGDFPPIFKLKENAQLFLDKMKWNVDKEIVELELI